MNKHEADIAKIKALNKGKLIEGLITIIIRLITAGVVCFCAFYFFEALTELAKGKADSLNALANIVEKLNIAQITSYIIGPAGLAYGGYQRVTKKKLEKQLTNT